MATDRNASDGRDIIEPHGIMQVPIKDRTRSFLEMGWMMGAVYLCLPVLTLMGLMVTGLPVGQALLAVIIGAILGVGFPLVGGYIGAYHGIPGTAASRATFGIRGAGIQSFNILAAAVGWYTAHILLTGLLINQVTSIWLGYQNLILWIVIIGVASLVNAVLGIDWIALAQKILVPLLFVVVVLSWAISMNNIGWTFNLSAGGSSGSPSFLGAVSTSLAVFMMSYVIASDYGRYTSDTPSAPLAGALFPFVIQVGFAIIAASLFMATGTPDLPQQMVDLGLLIPLTFIAIFATYTTNIVNLYSGGLAVTNTIPSLGRIYPTVGVGVVSIALSVFIATQLTFFEFLFLFLNIVGVLLISANVISAIDFAFRNLKFDTVDLFVRDSSSKYWYWGGVNIVAAGVWVFSVIIGWYAPGSWGKLLVAGIVAAAIYLPLALLVGPIKSSMSDDANNGDEPFTERVSQELAD